ncbi:uncharacterized protein SPPG_05666 [Spizellomyces punctatus DAOM BR117]|uniref:Apple domain-containing protein n=1 Tax=Spizellomyces punctatus (strain DAOM BR117) TaxID=645134 RepID=A0A0L0HD51_SPIPD|nr:uncharacterized protein SPPG_05666 [Spizellomyces punctatus DAOM BR117]KNC99425.1 hypothetical protein SPPG_05666 [Spizellomyces punctatus DAOM BR117]|eukprot:XP_016607465.1 hypothetical protein SPPG_05666 [Spizellomyces punctatus DAOM BR117]
MCMPIASTYLFLLLLTLPTIFAVDPTEPPPPTCPPAPSSQPKMGFRVLWGIDIPLGSTAALPLLERVVTANSACACGDVCGVANQRCDWWVWDGTLCFLRTLNRNGVCASLFNVFVLCFHDRRMTYSNQAGKVHYGLSLVS